MNSKLIFSFMLILSCGLFGCSITPNQSSALPIHYHNAQYALAFSLPASWKNYSVLTQSWQGDAYSPEKDKIVVLARGPTIVLRHPQWKLNDLYQDIPIYIFTRQQWHDIHLGKYDAAGAGGIIYELWHNNKYVFGIYSRYNADDSVNDRKEAQDIVNRNCAAHPEPYLYPE